MLASFNGCELGDGELEDEDEQQIEVCSNQVCTAAPTKTSDTNPATVQSGTNQVQVTDPSGNSDGKVAVTRPPQQLGNQDLLGDPGSDFIGRIFQFSTAIADDVANNIMDIPDSGQIFKLKYPPYIIDVSDDIPTDFGFDESPIIGNFGEPISVSTNTFHSNNKHKNSDSPWSGHIIDQMLTVPDAVASKNPTNNIMKIKARVPVSKGYIAKFKINRNQKNWNDPARYLQPHLVKHVTRKWLVGNVMYVSILIPQYASKASPSP